MANKPNEEHDVLELPNAAPNLINHELAPLKKQTWGTYNILCYWMSDVHSVGGYVFAGSLFALGLTSWQVLICLLVGIYLVQFVANKIAKPSQTHGVPYPVICRSPFGVLGANIPAIIPGRHRSRLAWYSDLSRLARAGCADAEAFSNAGTLRGQSPLRVSGPVRTWLGGIHDDVTAAGHCFLEWHGDGQKVCRFRRASCLCRHVPAHRLILKKRRSRRIEVAQKTAVIPLSFRPPHALFWPC